MSDAVIASYCRTPFHFARKGVLNQSRPDDLAAIAIRGLVDRAGIDPTTIEDVLMGCAYPEGEQGNNIARIASLLAGLPVTLGAATLNRFCGSSMYAIHVAAGQIGLGAGDAFICAGVESMSRVPQGGHTPSPNPRFPGRDRPTAQIMLQAYINMGETAENVARQYQVTRADQEEFALESQHKAAAAQRTAQFEGEIVPVQTATGLVESDGCLRPESTRAGLAALKPAFRPDGTVTAGTSSPLTDGAVAVLVCSPEYAAANHLEAFARIRSTAIAGCPPEIMGMGPVPAMRKALARAGLSIDDIDIVEINEAFSSQAVACMRELGIDGQRVNIHGGALALGHPLGATGARITAKAAQLLHLQGKRLAAAMQCIGGGQGIATILEAV